MARKSLQRTPIDLKLCNASSTDLNYIQEEFLATINRVDSWIESRKSNLLVGYGAGGRGVMTLAQLKYSNYFEALLDISYSNSELYTPLTAIPVVGPEKFEEYNSAEVLVFSFGYFDEILNNLVSLGYKEDCITNYLTIS